MKLTRFCDLKELEQLVLKGQVVPNKKRITFNNKGEVKLVLSILRSRLDFDDEFFAPKGYSIQNVISCEINGVKDSPANLYAQYKHKIKRNWRVC